MKKLLSITLALIMCLCAMAAGFTAVAADEAENLLAGASYEYQVGEFFSSFTDENKTLLTNGEYRGDGSNSFNGMYAVSGVSVELRGDRENGGTLESRRIDNVIVFTFDGVVSIDYLVFRGLRRIGNRYANIVSIETSSNGTEYNTVQFTETAEAISGAPQLGGSNQYFNVTTTFNTTATKVSYLKVTLNSVDAGGTLQYLVQLDEVEAYGSLTGKYIPAAELSLATAKENVNVGEYVTVTALFNSITAPNGIVACDLPLVYDTSHLVLLSCEGVYPTSWNGTGIMANEAAIPGQPQWLRLLCDANDLAANSDYNVKADGVFGVKLTFRAKAAGEATVAIDNIPEEGIFLLTVNGANFDNYGAIGSSVTVNISGEAAPVDKGDVNGDGETDNLDALIVLNYDAGRIELDDAGLEAGDIDGDGYVDNLDALMILKYDAGIIDEL